MIFIAMLIIIMLEDDCDKALNVAHYSPAVARSSMNAIIGRFDLLLFSPRRLYHYRWMVFLQPCHHLFQSPFDHPAR